MCRSCCPVSELRHASVPGCSGQAPDGSLALSQRLYVVQQGKGAIFRTEELNICPLCVCVRVCVCVRACVCVCARAHILLLKEVV